jgi:hypothetical protein
MTCAALANCLLYESFRSEPTIAIITGFFIYFNSNHYSLSWLHSA